MRKIDRLPCGRVPDTKDCDLSSLGLSLEEEVTLTVARLFFQSFCTPDSMAWIGAMAEAEARFGPEEGPLVAARLLGALQAIRRARRSTFLFNNPGCPGCSAIATEHERRLIVAIAALRRGDEGRARIEVMMLCEGNPGDRVVTALTALARTLGIEAPAPTEPAQDSVAVPQ